MCGIVGIWNLNGENINQETLDCFTDSLTHRGPDGRGTYIDNSRCLGLGHRRLSILDISEKGHQPMTYADKRYWIVFNGEIYNFIEIRNRLKGLGYSFYSDTDTEVILAAFIHWGEAAFEQFNGMWALAIWDSFDRRIFLSRDRFGVKPLFYYFDGKRFFFASELKAFLKLDCFDAVINNDNMYRILLDHHALNGTSESILQNVKELNAGHCINLSVNGFYEKRWWAIYNHLEPVPDTLNKQSEKFRELFFDACRIRMRSDVPIGTSLSGGLDSGAVVCSVNQIGADHNMRQSKDWQRAFIATYPDTVQDERCFADIVVKSTDIKPVYVEVNEAKVIDNISRIINASEEPCDVHIGPWLVYQEQRRSGVKVSLDGHGGDELLAGYIKYGIPGYMLKVPLLFLKGLFWLTNYRRYDSHHYHSDLVQAVPEQKGQMHFSTGNWMKFSPGNFSKKIYSAEEQDCLNKATPLFRMLYDEVYSLNLPSNLRDFDRCSMANGVEVRSPFLDWRVVCYAFSLPDESKLARPYTKVVLREAMRNILPETIRKRRDKIGFANPLNDWLKNGLKPLLLDTAGSQDFLGSEIWNGRMIKDDLEKEYQKSTNANTGVLKKAWPYICAQHMIRTYRKQV